MTKAQTIGACLAALGLALFTASCGGAAAYEADPGIEPEREDPTELAREQQQAELELFEALSQTEPQCAEACELRARICDLRGRICGIAERHPSDQATASRCEDAEASCTRSSTRVEQRCDCS